MAAPSVSFRISRSAEDLAETIHALSQRLVQLEQRLTTMEQQLASSEQQDPAELESLSKVERLLQDCRLLLTVDSTPQGQPLEPRPEQAESEPEKVFLDAA
jgi:predicted  nucleic acid-binding Zn-ribbon protein